MSIDPQGRLTDDGAQLEMPSGPVPEKLTELGKKQNTSDADWLSMTTADPAFFLKESGSE